MIWLASLPAGSAPISGDGGIDWPIYFAFWFITFMLSLGIVMVIAFFAYFGAGE